MHHLECWHANWCDSLFRSTSDHRFRIATADCLPRLTDGVPTSGTGRYSSPVWPTCSSHDGNNARCAVNDHHIDEKWANALWSFFMEDFELFVLCDQSTNAAPDIDTYIIRNLISNLQICMYKSLFASSNGQLFIGIVAACFLAVHKGDRIKIPDLTTEMNAESTCIISGNFADAGCALAYGFPCG